jgi:hypothetical protein
MNVLGKKNTRRNEREKGKRMKERKREKLRYIYI